MNIGNSVNKLVSNMVTHTVFNSVHESLMKSITFAYMISKNESIYFSVRNSVSNTNYDIIL